MNESKVGASKRQACCKTGAARCGAPATLAWLALGAALAGCSLSPQRLALRDSDSRDAELMATLRPAVWSRGDRPARGFEAGLQRYRAEGTQALETGESIVAGGTSITGPDELLQKARVTTWHFGYVDRLYFGPAFEFDVGVGGMKTEVAYEFVPRSGVTGAQPFGREVTLPYGTVTPRWRFNPFVALEARLLAAGLTDNAEHRRHDAALVLGPLPQVALRLGYSWRRTGISSWNDPLLERVDVRIRARGPAASLRVDF